MASWDYNSGTSDKFRIYTTNGTSPMSYGAQATAESRLLSRPIRVFWMGWETDTYKLQQNGWKIAVKQDIYRDYYEFLFRHEQMDLTALSAALQIHQVLTDVNMGGQYAAQLPPLTIERVVSRIEVYRDRERGNYFDDFVQIDAKPRMTSQKVSRLEDSNVFAVAIDKAEEVVIDRADMTVVDHLQAIKALQSEKQRVLRDKAREKEKTQGEVPVSGEVVIQLTEYRQ